MGTRWRRLTLFVASDTKLDARGPTLVQPFAASVAVRSKDQSSVVNSPVFSR